MQAGRQKAALPLIRRFNEHSERLLKSALLVAWCCITRVRLTEGTSDSGEGPSVKRRRLNDSNSMDVGPTIRIKYLPAHNSPRRKRITRRLNLTTSMTLKHQKGLL